MSILNDLMVWLNQQIPGLRLPVLPLKGWMACMVQLWNLPVDWQPSEGMPKRVQVEVGSPGWRLTVTPTGAIVFTSVTVTVTAPP